MANRKVSDESLKSIADAIRNTTGSEDLINFPDGFISVITDIAKAIKWEDTFVSGLINEHEYENSRVTRVGGKMFLSGYTSVSFPNVTDIQAYTFKTDSNVNGDLINANFPKCKQIEFGAFYNQRLNGVLDFSSVEKIYDEAFRYCNFSNIQLPNVKYIGNYAFCDCKNLSNIDLQLTTTIGSCAFYECSNLESINIPEVITIKDSCFSRCSKLKNIDLPKVESIERDSFEVCKSLTKADLKSVKKICYGSFYNCAVLETLIIRTNSICTLLDTNALTRTKIDSGTGYIYVPRSLIEDYKVATNWATYANQFRAIEDYPEICGGETV